MWECLFERILISMADTILPTMVGVVIFVLDTVVDITDYIKEKFSGKSS